MSKVTLSAALKSGKGNVRENNEDAFYFNGSYAELKDMNQEASLQCTYQDDSALFAICDGMGGYENGEIASFTAVSRMPELQHRLISTDFSVAVNQWVEETNKAILQAAQGGGCTLAMLFLHANKIYAAHIGDSRIYRYHHGKLIRLTKDHSKVQVLLDAGLIKEEEVDAYPQRHVITRALGMREEENGKCLPTIQKPIFTENGDRYIICSDGVTDMLSDNRLFEIISENESSPNCAEAIFKAAIEAGGKDNTSVIVVNVYCERDKYNDNRENSDPNESTLSPDQQEFDTVSIEQVTTIRRANGRTFTIKSQFSGSR